MKQKEIQNEVSKTRYQENPEKIIKHQKERQQENKKQTEFQKWRHQRNSMLKLEHNKGR